MKLKYIGHGEALPDIPARDLTEEECEKLDVQFLIKSGLYKPAESEEVKKSKRLETAQADGGN
jgi:hypothetical protein